MDLADWMDLMRPDALRACERCDETDRAACDSCDTMINYKAEQEEMKAEREQAKRDEEEDAKSRELLRRERNRALGLMRDVEDMVGDFLSLNYGNESIAQAIRSICDEALSGWRGENSKYTRMTEQQYDESTNGLCDFCGRDMGNCGINPAGKTRSCCKFSRKSNV